MIVLTTTVAADGGTLARIARVRHRSATTAGSSV